MSLFCGHQWRARDFIWVNSERRDHTLKVRPRGPMCLLGDEKPFEADRLTSPVTGFLQSSVSLLAEERKSSYVCCRINEDSYTSCYQPPTSARSSALFLKVSVYCACLGVCTCTRCMPCLQSRRGHWIHCSWSYRQL